MSEATITLDASDIQGILEDLDSKQLIESFSYSKYNGIEIEWNVRCSPIEWEVSDVVDIDEYDRLEEQFKDLQVDYEQLDEVKNQLATDYDALKQSRDVEYDELKRKYDELLIQCNALETELSKKQSPWFKRLFGK